MAGRGSAPGSGPFSSDVGLVAAREVRERFRGRIFRIGTLVILAVIAAAIVIPVLDRGTPQPHRVGVVGALPASWRATVVSAAKTVGTTVHFVPEADQAAAHRALRSGAIDFAVVDGRELVVDRAISSTATSTTAQLVRAVATGLGVIEAVEAAHLTPTQRSTLYGAKPIPVRSLRPAPPHAASHGTSLVGLVLIFLMLSQYNTWILIGVMEEKSSRVIEVLLAAVRPIQLLTGKVLGIGLVALAQASVVVAFSLVLAASVGSDLLHGTAPLVLVSTLVWLALGYAFYCWVYAAAGSMAERQAQVQSLALPLSIPILFGYITAITVANSGNVSTFFRVLAYLPPTAPFAMPVLVGLGAVSLWQFLVSAAICVVSIIGVARLASGVYRRAILRSGGRVRLREVLSRTGG